MDDECVEELGRPISSMKVAELRDELTRRSLTKTGNKKELIDRLRTAIQRQSSQQPSSSDQANQKLQQNVPQYSDSAITMQHNQAAYQHQLNQIQPQASLSPYTIPLNQQQYQQTMMQPMDLQQQLVDYQTQVQIASADFQKQQEQQQQYQAAVITLHPPIDMRLTQQAQHSPDHEKSSEQTIDLSSNSRQHKHQERKSSEAESSNETEDSLATGRVSVGEKAEGANDPEPAIEIDIPQSTTDIAEDAKTGEIESVVGRDNAEESKDPTDTENFDIIEREEKTNEDEMPADSQYQSENDMECGNRSNIEDSITNEEIETKAMIEIDPESQARDETESVTQTADELELNVQTKSPLDDISSHKTEQDDTSAHADAGIDVSSQETHSEAPIRSTDSTEAPSRITLSLKRCKSNLKLSTPTGNREKRRKWSSNSVDSGTQSRDSSQTTIISGGISSQKLQELIDDKPSESKPAIAKQRSLAPKTVESAQGSQENSQELEEGEIGDMSGDSKTAEVAERDKINVKTEENIVENDATNENIKPDLEPKCEPTNILLVQNLVRPFTLSQLKEVLTKHGPIVEDKFWTDKVKSKCCVMYETIEVAKITKESLHGQQWPTSNPKTLKISYANEEILMQFQNSDLTKAGDTGTKSESAINGSTQNDQMQKQIADRLGERVDDGDGLTKTDTIKNRLGEKTTGEVNTKSSTINKDGDISKPQELDDLFKKTNSVPHLFWLPLTESQADTRQKERAAKRVPEVTRNFRRSPPAARSSPARRPTYRNRSPIGAHRRSPVARRSPIGRRSPARRSPTRHQSPSTRRSPKRYRSPIGHRPSPRRRFSPEHDSPRHRPIGLAKRSPELLRRTSGPSRRSPRSSKRSPGPIRRSPALIRRSPLPSKRSPGPIRRSPRRQSRSRSRSPGPIRRFVPQVRHSPPPVRGFSPARRFPPRERSPPRRRL